MTLTILLLLVFLSALATEGNSVALGACSSLEKVPELARSDLLTTFAPIWWSPEDGSSGPQPISWMSRHGYFKIFRKSDGIQVGRIPIDEIPYTPDQLLEVYSTSQQDFPTAAFEYRWAYYNADLDRFNRLSGDPMNWAICRDSGVGVYGRVWRCTDWAVGHFSVQYFMHWGWNETDTPPGCDEGNHEGDWIGVDLTVDSLSLRILSAIYHNHGRQIFIDDPNSLVMTGNHPHVFLERGTNEPWPFAGPSGFKPDHVPPGVSTNKRLMHDVLGRECPFEYETGCNREYTAVREHEANGGSFLINPTDLGDRSNPGSSPEARFIMRYSGLYGSEWHPGPCFFGIIPAIETSSPPGPPFDNNGEKMWDRNFLEARVWDSGAGPSIVWVSPGATSRELLLQSHPFRYLARAVAFVAVGGRIELAPGAYHETGITIKRPCTLHAPSGPATIGE